MIVTQSINNPHYLELNEGDECDILDILEDDVSVIVRTRDGRVGYFNLDFLSTPTEVVHHLMIDTPPSHLPCMQLTEKFYQEQEEAAIREAEEEKEQQRRAEEEFERRMREVLCLYMTLSANAVLTRGAEHAAARQRRQDPSQD